MFEFAEAGKHRTGCALPHGTCAQTILVIAGVTASNFNVI